MGSLNACRDRLAGTDWMRSNLSLGRQSASHPRFFHEYREVPGGWYSTAGLTNPWDVDGSTMVREP